MKKTSFITRSLLFAVIFFSFSLVANAKCEIWEVQKGQGFISLFQEMKVCIKTFNKQSSVTEKILKTNVFSLSLQKGFLIKQGNKFESPIVPLHSSLFFDEVGNLCFRPGKTGVSKIIIAVNEQSITSVTQPIMTFSVQRVQKVEVVKSQLRPSYKEDSIQSLNIEKNKLSDSISKNLVSSISTQSSSFQIENKRGELEKVIKPKSYWDSLFNEAYKKQMAFNLLREKAEKKVRENDCKIIKANKKIEKSKIKLSKL